MAKRLSQPTLLNFLSAAKAVAPDKPNESNANAPDEAIASTSHAQNGDAGDKDVLEVKRSETASTSKSRAIFRSLNIAEDENAEDKNSVALKKRPRRAILYDSDDENAEQEVRTPRKSIVSVKCKSLSKLGAAAKSSTPKGRKTSFKKKPDDHNDSEMKRKSIFSAKLKPPSKLGTASKSSTSKGPKISIKKKPDKHDDSEIPCSETATKSNTDDENAEDKKSVASKKRPHRSILDDSDDENAEQELHAPKKSKFLEKWKLPSKLETPTESSTSKGQKTTVKKNSKKDGEEPVDGKSTANEKSAHKWLHETLPFLHPAAIMDAEQRKPDHPDYDPSTLFVPKPFLTKLTPAMRQWWVLKCQNFDTVLFFKVGKFYELYHMDATIGVKCLGCAYMKGAFAHSGFPEIAFGRMSSSLIEQGYKVARVEQTETPEMMQERCKQLTRGTKFDRVVNREICQISMKGIDVVGVQSVGDQPTHHRYLLALCEKDVTSSQKCGKYFGVCFIDIADSVFHLAEFDDDKHCSRLLTLLANHNTELILVEKHNLMNDTLSVITLQLKGKKLETLRSGKEFLDAETTVKTLKNGPYFRLADGTVMWPQALDDMIECERPKPEYTQCLKSLGACVWYLKKCLVDLHVLQLKKFQIYCPTDLISARYPTCDLRNMVLDNLTIDNLHLLDGDGGLVKTLDYCCTPFGKRLLQTWICQPICNLNDIQLRQAAVRELYSNEFDVLNSTRALLAKLPDLPRQLVKIHRFGNETVAQTHPDSRAIFYEMNTYSKRKIVDFVSTLNAFELISQIPKLFHACDSTLLDTLTQFPPFGHMKDTHELLSFYQTAFDHERAKRDGRIIPESGVDDEYDEAEKNVAKVQEKLDGYLQTQCAFFDCDVKYFGTDKKRYQLEIPANRRHLVTPVHQFESSRKGAKPCFRYSTRHSRTLLDEMRAAEAHRTKVLLDINRRMFEKFGQSSFVWELVIHNVQILDCLCALAQFAKLYTHELCMPNMLTCSETICTMKNARHPCLANDSKVDFVPNDIMLGKPKQVAMVLTGANMGGKSTFMRQTAIIAIMAQIGSFVTAESCDISIIDRIFTRMGAYDDLMKGQSTLLVELSEANAILMHATRHSFVLLDELGRGTSTLDGLAIARACLDHLAAVKCRAIFSTHYHSLAHLYEDSEAAQLSHMDCMVHNESDNEQRITFLYKVVPGTSPKSYGFNVAALANVPQAIVNTGQEYAYGMESKQHYRSVAKRIMSMKL